MFHVTRCPNCQTSFRVTDAHLASFEGKVRCGRCAFVFDARRYFVGEPRPVSPAPAPGTPFASAVPPAAQAPAQPTPVAVPVPAQPVLAHASVADEANLDEGYGAASVSAQLKAAAEVEDSHTPSLAQNSLNQLAAALATPEPQPARSQMLELNLDLDPSAGLEAEPFQLIPPPPPMPVPELAIENWVEDLNQHPLDTSPAATPVESPAPAPVPRAPAPAPEPPVVVPPAPVAIAVPSPVEAPPAYEEAPFYAVEPPVPAMPAAPATTPLGQPTVAGYHPIFTAEDEALLRVPQAPSPWRWLWSIPIFLALLGLVGQLAFHYRTELSLQLPGIKPHLKRFCAELGCTVDLPSRAEWLRTEWSELNFVPDNPTLIQLTATLRNQALFEQTLPLLELTLLDDQDRIAARKIFTARDYLAPASGSPLPAQPASFAPGSDLRIFLRVDVGKLKSSGYQLNWFYPERH